MSWKGGNGHPDWPEEHEARVKELWADKVSAGAIALKLYQETGHAYSRNAIIGKAHRMGLPKRGRSFKAKNGDPKPERTHPIKLPKVAKPEKLSINKQNGTVAPAPSQPMPEPFPEPIENIIPIGQRCSILELADDKCHWPIGDPHAPDFAFCGGKAVMARLTASTRVKRLPYCLHHARLAFPYLDQRR